MYSVYHSIQNSSYWFVAYRQCAVVFVVEPKDELCQYQFKSACGSRKETLQTLKTILKKTIPQTSKHRKNQIKTLHLTTNKEKRDYEG